MENTEKLMNANVKLSHVTFLPGIAAFPDGEDLERPFNDLYDLLAISDERSAELMNMFVKYATDSEIDTCRERSELFIEEAGWFGKLNGFIVQASTPIPTFHGDHHSYSWGWVTMKWIFAESMDSACEMAIKWAGDYFNECKQKAA